METGDIVSEIEIRNFKLYYDGIFSIGFTYNGQEIKNNVYLPPYILLKVLKNEGITNMASEEDFDFIDAGVSFTKSTLVFNVVLQDGEIVEIFNSPLATENYMGSDLPFLDCSLKE